MICFTIQLIFYSTIYFTLESEVLPDPNATQSKTTSYDLLTL